MTDSDSEPERGSSVGSVKLSYDHVPEETGYLWLRVRVSHYSGSFDNGWWSFKEEMASDLEMNGELKCFCVLSVLHLYSCRCDDKQK